MSDGVFVGPIGALFAFFGVLAVWNMAIGTTEPQVVGVAIAVGVGVLVALGVEAILNDDL